MRPGDVVRDLGIYECNCGSHHIWSAEVPLATFPALPEGCSGSKWEAVVQSTIEDVAVPQEQRASQ
jgi:hypothetical protein